MSKENLKNGETKTSYTEMTKKIVDNFQRKGNTFPTYQSPPPPPKKK